QQGFAITQSRDRLNQFISTLGGYVMPPMMLYLGFLMIDYQYPSIFITAYLITFVYFLLITSRKSLLLLIVVLVAGILFFLFHTQNELMVGIIVCVTLHFILVVLLGEVLQSSWTIGQLTFAKQKMASVGSALGELSHLLVILFSVIWIAINLYTVYQLFNS